MLKSRWGRAAATAVRGIDRDGHGGVAGAEVVLGPHRGLSLHNYTVVRFAAAYKSVGFDEEGYAEIVEDTVKMDGMIGQHSAIMDQHDPEKEIALMVDEWGSWYAKLPG